MLGCRAQMFKDRIDLENNQNILQTNKEFSTTVEKWLINGPDIGNESAMCLHTMDYSTLIMHTQSLTKENIKQYSNMAAEYGVSVDMQDGKICFCDKNLCDITLGTKYNLGTDESFEAIMTQLRESFKLILHYEKSIMSDSNKVDTILQYVDYVRCKLTNILVLSSRT